MINQILILGEAIPFIEKCISNTKAWEEIIKKKSASCVVNMPEISSP